MSKTNIILVAVIMLFVGTGTGYTFAMSGGHDEDYLKKTADMMKSDSVMMKDMFEMTTMNGKMMQERGTKYNDSELSATGKTMVEKASKMEEMGKEMMKRGNEMMDMM